MMMGLPVRQIRADVFADEDQTGLVGERGDLCTGRGCPGCGCGCYTELETGDIQSIHH